MKNTAPNEHKAQKSIFVDYDEFCREVKLLTNPAELRQAGAPAPELEDGMYETFQLADLVKFCKSNPQFHIATLMDYGRFYIQNRLAWVNRLGYYLASGNDNQELVLIEDAENSEDAEEFEPLGLDEFWNIEEASGDSSELTNLQMSREKHSLIEIENQIVVLLSKYCFRVKAEQIKAINGMIWIADTLSPSDEIEFNRQLNNSMEKIVTFEGNGWNYIFNNCCVKEFCPRCRLDFKAPLGICPVDFDQSVVCDECGSKPEPESRPAEKIPTLDIKTDEFREKFPKDQDFFDFMETRNELMSRSSTFAGELSNTLAKCPVCTCFTSMSDLIGIAFVEKSDAVSNADLEDNFYGCAYCFIRHLEKHSEKIGRIGF